LKSLWQIIDLRAYSNHLTMSGFCNMLDQYGSTALLKLFLAGNWFNDKHSNESTNSNGKLCHVTKTLFYLIRDKSANLEHVSLEYLNLTDLTLCSLVSLKNLKEISLKWCFLDQQFFTNNQFEMNQNIVSLSLIRTHCLLNDKSIEAICRSMPHLKCLCINQIKSSIDDNTVKILVCNANSLEKLELINTLISDLSIEYLCCKFSLKLKHLNLSLNSYLTNTSVLLIGNCMHELQTLYLTSCFCLTNIDSLNNLSKLKYLNLNNTSICKSYIKEFILNSKNDCEIEHGHEKMLSTKQAWTINGSKNSVCSF
jgi:hypothetical protein